LGYLEDVGKKPWLSQARNAVLPNLGHKAGVLEAMVMKDAIGRLETEGDAQARFLPRLSRLFVRAAYLKKVSASEVLDAVEHVDALVKRGKLSPRAAGRARAALQPALQIAVANVWEAPIGTRNERNAIFDATYDNAPRPLTRPGRLVPLRQLRRIATRFRGRTH
jgi:hypothetical protein